jgi:hypothetical protein
VLWRLVCDVARMRREEVGCLVCMRRGCDITGLLDVVPPANDGVRFERFERFVVLRKVVWWWAILSSSSSRTGLLECSLSRSEFWYEAAMGGV